jgi:uncharacterized membrane protein
MGRTDRDRSPAGEPGTERIVAFSDGVFAIAITLLILNVGVSATGNRLPEELRNAWPEYLSYALSFLIIGIIWAQHHALFTLIRRTDHILLLINIVFLMWVAFLPFPAHVLGEHLGKAGQQAAMTFYAGTFLVGALPFNLLWRYASYGKRLLGDKVDRRLVRVISRSYAFGPVLYALDLALSFLSAPVSLAFFFLIAVFYAVAPIPAVGRTRLMRPFTGLEGTQAADVESPAPPYTSGE